jgi:hypothetical protein
MKTWSLPIAEQVEVSSLPSAREPGSVISMVLHSARLVRRYGPDAVVVFRMSCNRRDDENRHSMRRQLWPIKGPYGEPLPEDHPDQDNYPVAFAAREVVGAGCLILMERRYRR